MRLAAEEHVRALVEGRVEDAVAWVVEEGKAAVRESWERLAQPVEGTVEDVRQDMDQFVVLLWFRTAPDDEFGVVIESHWAGVRGRPMLHWADLL